MPYPPVRGWIITSRGCSVQDKENPGLVFTNPGTMPAVVGTRQAPGFAFDSEFCRLESNCSILFMLIPTTDLNTDRIAKCRHVVNYFLRVYQIVRNRQVLFETISRYSFTNYLTTSLRSGIVAWNETTKGKSPEAVLVGQD